MAKDIEDLKATKNDSHVACVVPPSSSAPVKRLRVLSDECLKSVCPPKVSSRNCRAFGGVSTECLPAAVVTVTLLKII